MLRNLLLFSCFLLLVGPLWSQSFTVKGQVYDAENFSPLPGAYIGIRGEVGAYAGENGVFKLTIEGPGSVVLVVKYLGYLSQSIVVDPSQGKSLSVKMVADPITLAPTLITDQALRKIHPDDELHIKDYALIGDQYLMIVHDNEVQQNKLILQGSDGKILAEHYGFGEEPKSLVKDCIGSYHFLSASQACQIDLVTGALFVQRGKRSEFDAVVAPCRALLDDTYYFERQMSKYSSGYYYIEKDKLARHGFYLTVDTASLITLEDEALMPSRYATTDQLDIDGTPGAFHTILNNNFLADVNCPATFAPLHIVKGKVTIFDHIQNKIVRFDESVKVVKEVPIDYHERRFWEATLVVDEAQMRAFTVYFSFGKTTLAEISLEDGTILRERELPKKFVSNIKVKGDEVFFLYKDNIYDPVQRLYAFDMTR